MVGSVTFALFGETTADLKPEEVYALHCCWSWKTMEIEEFLQRDPLRQEEGSSVNTIQNSDK